jgi:hypothetical protein
VSTETEEPHVETLRRLIVEQYAEHPTGTGHSFGEILCHEIHENGLTFVWLAEKWGVSLATLGELIADHCRRLEKLPRVWHEMPPTERPLPTLSSLRGRAPGATGDLSSVDFVRQLRDGWEPQDNETEEP